MKLPERDPRMLLKTRLIHELQLIEQEHKVRILRYEVEHDENGRIINVHVVTEDAS